MIIIQLNPKNIKMIFVNFSTGLYFYLMFRKGI